MGAYYNEYDKNAAEWLRQLIKLGLIADGVVDDRSITDVEVEDLNGFVQCHFFAGIGVWSHALRAAGWPDDEPIWTGSCPCQPFSSAGRQKGTDDERHLFPTWMHLIRECKPPVILGEQVEAAVRHGWWDAVSDGLEREGYACGAVAIPACGLGAPHIRQRLWFCAVNPGCSGGVDVSKEVGCGWGLAGKRQADHAGRGTPEDCRSGCSNRLVHTAKQGLQVGDGKPDAKEKSRDVDQRSGDAGGVSKPVSSGLQGQRGDGGDRDEPGRVTPGRAGSAPEKGTALGLADANAGQQGVVGRSDLALRGGAPWDARPRLGRGGDAGRSHPTNGFWANPDWLYCRDGKWRPVKSGAFALVNGASSELVPSCDLGAQDVEATKEAKAMRLKGYGNAIVAPAAAAFISAVIQYLGDQHPCPSST